MTNTAEALPGVLTPLAWTFWNEPEPVVLAYVSLDHPDIAEEDRVPVKLRTTSGIEVLAKVRCGDAAMGYSLFYGVWEFLCEKVLFAF